MGQLADVLIAEIVDTGLLGENIIAATSDARRLLCKADVIIIPDGAAAYAGSIKSEEITRERSVNESVQPFASHDHSKISLSLKG